MVIRCKPKSGSEASRRKWLMEKALDLLPTKPGMVGVHLLEGAVAAPMTKEQSIRGADAGVDWALVLTGYGEEALRALRQDVLGNVPLDRHGAAGVTDAAYRLDYTLTETEAKA